jgi:glycosyltransferase involved in cell wall biosynthesis
MTKYSDETILSICIPTYNRPKELERMLLGLLPQLTKETEVVIRDDSSNFKSKEIIDRLFAGKGINHQYFSGDKIGLDAASLFLLEHAKGRFFWLFSDDDELLDGGVAEVIRLVKTYPEINLIWANFDSDLPRGTAINNRRSGFFRDGSEALEVVGTGIGLVSTQIFRRESGLLGLDIARKHVVGFSFASTAIFLHVLSGPGKFYFLEGPYVLCHPTTIEDIKQVTTKTGKIINEGFNVYGIDFYSIVKEFDDKFSKRSIRKILSTNYSSLWRGMLVGWVGGWDTPTGKRWKMFQYYWNFPEFWVAILFFLMPLWVNKLLYRLYKIFFSHRKFIFSRSGSAR